MNTSTMPPPPLPAKRAILEREASVLSACFKNAVVKTGQIYAFHADARRLGIHNYAPYPRRTLTASLGRELEKYDQVCDAIELQLLRAISVLKRDLTREERRARAAEQAALAVQVPKIPVPSIEAGDAATLPILGHGLPHGPQHIPMRRQSAISLSSLNRSALPPKLDLSSSSMRISAEEAALFPKGLVPSPVSLAPKSARTSATADIDLMAALASAAAANSNGQRVDIDLTDDGPPAMMSRMDPSLGSSADKPIELDLDNMDMGMSDMFGDAPQSRSGDGQTPVDNLFSPATGDEHGSQGGHLFASVASRSGGGSRQPQSGSSVAPPSSGFTQVGMQGSAGGFDLATLDLSNLDPTAWHNMSLTDMEALLNMPSNQEGQKPGL